ncbi:hypothetical protein Ciccas_013678 [Cichlidogyrus casuarinus]|uniref:Uncharacterized protein n=1 Tax=Cichlidogyrus casuarinus TaxID=1844966 RepID=A0ABD2PL74_9PLAT
MGTLYRRDEGSGELMLEGVDGQGSDGMVYQRLNNFNMLANRVPTSEGYYPIVFDAMKNGPLLVPNGPANRTVLTPQFSPKFATITATQKAQLLTLSQGATGRPLLSATEFGLKQGNQSGYLSVSRPGSIHKNRLNNEANGGYQTINQNLLVRACSRQGVGIVRAAKNDGSSYSEQDEEDGSLSSVKSPAGSCYYTQESMAEQHHQQVDAQNSHGSPNSQQITNYFQTSFV